MTKREYVRNRTRQLWRLAREWDDTHPRQTLPPTFFRVITQRWSTLTMVPERSTLLRLNQIAPPARAHTLGPSFRALRLRIHTPQVSVLVR